MFLQIFLFIVFIVYFAKPDVERYIKAEVIILINLNKILISIVLLILYPPQVMIVRETINSKGIPSPAITIVGRQPPKNGWRINSGSKLEHTCKTYQDNQTERCIEENTFNKTEIVKDILLGSKSDLQAVLKGQYLSMNRSISVLQNLSPSFTVTIYGMTFTWSSSAKISPNLRLLLCLPFNKSYMFYIHDKGFFVPNNVPEISGFPRLFLKSNPTGSLVTCDKQKIYSQICSYMPF